MFMKKKSSLRLIAADSDIAECFDSAVHNAVQINTVRCRYRKYNRTGLLRYPYMIRAGKNYKTPWTRDAELTGIKIHGQDFSVRVKGYGNKIKKFILDGKEYEPFVKWDNKAHKVEIILERL